MDDFVVQYSADGTNIPAYAKAKLITPTEPDNSHDGIIELDEHTYFSWHRPTLLNKTVKFSERVCAMELLKDLLLVLGRIYTIYPLLLGVTLFMGRRSIGELPVFDYIIILSLGSVIGADIADPKIEHIHTAFAIVAIGVLQKIASVLHVKSRRIGKWITFEPMIVVKDGKFIYPNLKKPDTPSITFCKCCARSRYLT